MILDEIPINARRVRLSDNPDGTGAKRDAHRDQPGGSWWIVEGFPGMVETEDLMDFGWPRVTHRFTEVPT